MQKPQPLSVDVIYELALSRLEAQLRQFDGIDNKLSLILTVSSLIIGIAASFLIGIHGPFSQISVAFLALAAAAYFAVITLVILAYRVLTLSYPPNIRQARLRLLHWEPSMTKRQVLAQLVEAIEENRELLVTKARNANLALYLSAVEVAGVVAAAASITFS